MSQRSDIEGLQTSDEKNDWNDQMCERAIDAFNDDIASWDERKIAVDLEMWIYASGEEKRREIGAEI